MGQYQCTFSGRLKDHNLICVSEFVFAYTILRVWVGQCPCTCMDGSIPYNVKGWAGGHKLYDLNNPVSVQNVFLKAYAYYVHPTINLVFVLPYYVLVET